jgi:hypothetical protein
MALFSAKFKLISVISSTPDTWAINAYIVDAKGIFYAADARVDDLVYCEDVAGILKFKLSDITLTTGTRIIGKLTWVGEGIPVAPSIAKQAIIGSLEDAKLQGLNGLFITAIEAVQKDLIDAGGTEPHSSAIDGGSPTTNYTPEQTIDAGGP